MPRRVVLVDTREQRRHLMRLVMDGDEARAIVVGEADGRAAALAMVDQQHADVVVLDVHMPVAEGLATIRMLRKEHPRLGIVVCSFDLNQATVQRALAEGADTCLAKPVNRTDVHAALGLLPQEDRPVDSSLGSPPVGTLAAPVGA